MTRKLEVRVMLRQVAISAIALCVPVANAFAATATDSFQVTATVISSCAVDAADLAFGAYNPVSGSPLDAASSMSVQCTNGTTYVVSLDAGAGSGASIASRRMSNSGQTLTYSLYQNAGRTTVWGNSVGVDTVAGTGSGAAQLLNIYGRAPAQQTAPAGAYSDTVTVTVTY